MLSVNIGLIAQTTITMTNYSGTPHIYLDDMEVTIQVDDPIKAIELARVLVDAANQRLQNGKTEFVGKIESNG